MAYEDKTAGEPLEYVIIGGGPAGIQAAYFLKQAGRSFAVLERASEVGNFFRQFPRHRQLISINKVYTGYDDAETNLRWDWNSLLSDDFSPLFKDYSRDYFPHADVMVDYLKDFVTSHELDIELGVTVSSIERTDSGFVVNAADGRVWNGARLIVATGVSAEYTPPIPGVELCERYGEVSVDPEDFAGQRVLIIGKGNSGFETADNLVSRASTIHLASRNPIKMAWRTHFVGDLRAVNNNLLDTYQLKLQNALLDGEITHIRRHGDGYKMEIRYAHADGEVEELYYDRVLLCAGFGMDTSIFSESCKPEMTSDGRFPLQTASWESANVPGLYFAGTLMQQRDLKKYMSGFIHGFRYNVKALTQHLLATYHDTPWPSQPLEYSTRALLDTLLAEMNQSSAIWQQPGFLTRVVRVDRDAGEAELLGLMSVDYAHEHYSDDKTTLMLTLEYGQSNAPDPFFVERVHREDSERAQASQFLHPVVRCFERGELLSEHHVLEDLAAEWWEPEHINPLRAYLRQVLRIDESTTSSAGEAETQAEAQASSYSASS